MNQALQTLEAAVATHAANEARIATHLREVMKRSRVSGAWAHELSVDLAFRPTARSVVAQAFSRVARAGEWGDVLRGATAAYEASVLASGISIVPSFTKTQPSLEPEPLITLAWIIEETVATGVEFLHTNFSDREPVSARLEQLGRATLSFAYHAYYSTRS